MNGFAKIAGFWVALEIIAAAPAENSGLGAMQAKALMEQARPHLEAVLGHRLDVWPAIRVAAGVELADRDRGDLAGQIRWQFPDLQGASLERAVDVALRAWHAATVVAREPGGSGLLLLSDNLRSLSQWDERLGPANSPAFLQLALVYELARADAERRHGLDARRAMCRDAETYRAGQAALDGYALWVTGEVSGRLGTSTYVPLWAERLRHVPDPEPDPGLRDICQHVLRQRYEGCTRGRVLCETLVQAVGVRAAEQRLLGGATPPATWFDRPAQCVGATASPRLEDGLRSVEGLLPADEWMVEQLSWTPDMVRQAAALLGAQHVADRIVEKWQEGRVLVWTRRDAPVRQVAVSVARFESAAAARLYCEFALELGRRQEAQPSDAASGFQTVEARCRSVSMPGADEAVWIDKQIRSAASDPTPVSVLRARAGSLVVEVSWSGTPADAGWAERLVKALH